MLSSQINFYLWHTVRRAYMPSFMIKRLKRYSINPQQRGKRARMPIMSTKKSKVKTLRRIAITVACSMNIPQTRIKSLSILLTLKN